MNGSTNKSDNPIILTAYLSGYDDEYIKGDILCDVRRRYFLDGKKVKDKMFFTSGIDNVRCAYQIDKNKPMKWKKEINGRLSEYSQVDSSGSYAVIYLDGDKIRKKLYFSRDNIWQKSEYFNSSGALEATVTASLNNSKPALAVQFGGGEPVLLVSGNNENSTGGSISAIAKTTAGEYYFNEYKDGEEKPEKTGDDMQRKGFFFDSALIYGDFTTLNIKEGIRSVGQKEENSDEAPALKTDNPHSNAKNEKKTAVVNQEEIPDDFSEYSGLSEAVADIEINNSEKEKYFYFGAKNKANKRSGSGVTLTSKGEVLYSGEYKNDLRCGFGAQFYKNGRLAYAGRWSDGKKNGFGISFMSDGSVVAGSFENDKRKGASARFDAEGRLLNASDLKSDTEYGLSLNKSPEDGKIMLYRADPDKHRAIATIIDNDGCVVYNGEIVDGQYSGRGRLFDKNGALRYSGEFKNGLKNGSGTLHLDDGSFISGEFLNGDIKGDAVHRAADGRIIYIGGFKNCEYCGKGTLYNPDGSYYSATFASGRERGAISVYSKSGELQYKGGMKNGKYNGKGALYSDGVKIFEGSFAQGRKNGMGREYADNLCVYMGEFENDLKSGFGISYRDNRVEYSGFWKNGRYDGQGAYHSADDGLDYAGTFINGKMDGRINIVSGETLIKETLFDGGKCVYMREYNKNGEVVYDGAVSGGRREGMGCSYTEYGEKIFEGIFKYGEPYKAMKVISKPLSELEYSEKLKDTAYGKYIKPPVFVSEQPLGKGIYSGSLKNGVPNGNGTMLFTDHRYTGEFKNGAPDGNGVLYFGDGKEISGRFFADADPDCNFIEFADASYYLKNECEHNE